MEHFLSFVPDRSYCYLYVEIMELKNRLCWYTAHIKCAEALLNPQIQKSYTNTKPGIFKTLHWEYNAECNAV